ncbi:MAG TPA: hypothetical protein PK874_13180 [Desulfobacteraceae bacterium]|nr:hypothetical protein [Desulfobacteraceae bacterium]HPJ67394.1 hypothetical protein [Desulfobacteraceae bacterium]
MVPQNNALLKYLLIILLCSIAGGCTSSGSTKPNEPFHGSYPDSFKEIIERNPLLAKEIGKLPEIQDGISSDEIIVLKRLGSIYKENPKDFNGFFTQMYQTGLSEVRKYCSPLQALFWLVQENPELAYECIKEKELKSLLWAAWDYSDKSKWGNPQDIMDRLNSPELFEYWFRINFRYDWSKLPISDPMSALQPAKRSLIKKKGVCTDAAYLAFTCLGRAGYETIPLRSYFFKKSSQHPLGGFVGHTICVIKKGNEFFIAGDTNLFEMTKRPFRDLKEIAEYMAACHGCSLDGFTTGFNAFYRLRW